MRHLALAFALILALPSSGLAQHFDSGWRRIGAANLGDLELSGGDLRVNNLLVAATDDRANRPANVLANHSFSMSVVKRGAGERSALIEIVGMKADNTPTVTSLVVVRFSDRETNRLKTDTHRFPAYPAEVAATTDYFVRVLVQ